MSDGVWRREVVKGSGSLVRGSAAAQLLHRPTNNCTLTSHKSEPHLCVPKIHPTTPATPAQTHPQNPNIPEILIFLLLQVTTTTSDNRFRPPTRRNHHHPFYNGEGSSQVRPRRRPQQGSRMSHLVEDLCVAVLKLPSRSLLSARSLSILPCRTAIEGARRGERPDGDFYSHDGVIADDGLSCNSRRPKKGERKNCALTEEPIFCPTTEDHRSCRQAPCFAHQGPPEQAHRFRS